MDNITLVKKNDKIEELSSQLGFAKTLFSEDVVVVKADSTKKLLSELKKAKGRKTIYIPKTEKLLRFALEKTKVDMVLGVENIHPKDSVHYLRGGLDQVLCKIAASKGKIIAFSFSDILNSSNKGKLMARMMANIRLCKKYKAKMLFSSFAKNKHEMRSNEDLYSLWKILNGTSKNDLKL